MDPSGVRHVEHGHGGEKDVVEVGASEGDMSESIEEVPGEENTGFEGRFRRNDGVSETTGGNNKTAHYADRKDAFVIKHWSFFEVWQIVESHWTAHVVC